MNRTSRPNPTSTVTRMICQNRRQSCGVNHESMGFSLRDEHALIENELSSCSMIQLRTYRPDKITAELEQKGELLWRLGWMEYSMKQKEGM